MEGNDRDRIGYPRFAAGCALDTEAILVAPLTAFRRIGGKRDRLPNVGVARPDLHLLLSTSNCPVC